MFLRYCKALVAAVVVAMALGGAAHAKTLKIQSLWSAGSENFEVFKRFAENVGKASGGELTIEPMPVKSVVAHNETLEAVSAGILDGQHTALSYFSGRDAAFGLLGDLNTAYETPYQMQQWFYARGGLEIARELYKQHGLYFIGPVWWGVESIPVSKKVATVEQFEGVKLRMPEGPANDIFHKIGAAPVNIPGSEVFTSLERGVIDGTDWGTLSMNQDLGYHKIAQYPIYPGIHSMPTADVAINLDTWNSLSDEHKALLEMAVFAFSNDMIMTMKVKDMAARQKAQADGAELVDWSAEERKKLRAIAAGVWKEYSERSPMAKKVYDSQIAWLKELGAL
jgi:TRAP-type mannitol/chloroaromatic compound transport system substrate-binding protein